MSDRKEWKARIGQRMSECIETWFTAEPMRRTALFFLASKLEDNMLFGQLTAIHYGMFSGKGADMDAASAGVELFILASDILDDLEDGDAKDKPWMNVPLASSIHIATALVTLAQQVLLDAAPNDELRGRLAAMTNRQLLRSANGQMLDLENDIRTEEAYLEMIEGKSASLMVWACMAGVMLAGRGWDESVANYAKELGMAAQLSNDARDMLRWDDKSDFLQRKWTLVSIYLLEWDDEQAVWIRDYYGGRLTEADLRDKRELFLQACQQSGASLYGAVVSRMHYNRFAKLVEEMDADEGWKSRLLALTAGYVASEMEL
ncbi:polyprenyl synthetase family protein [Paenibacillus sp. PL2-23]|uniref:polyprenyl synthetase family protein n=1 Tax=Paenibacillus sp. PL2-23 TaxID=2100729 RepID=UPI0030F76624